MNFANGHIFLLLPKNVETKHEIKVARAIQYWITKKDGVIVCPLLYRSSSKERDHSTSKIHNFGSFDPRKLTCFCGSRSGDTDAQKSEYEYRICKTPTCNDKFSWRLWKKGEKFGIVAEDGALRGKAMSEKTKFKTILTLKKWGWRRVWMGIMIPIFVRIKENPN